MQQKLENKNMMIDEQLQNNELVISRQASEIERYKQLLNDILEGKSSEKSAVAIDEMYHKATGEALHTGQSGIKISAQSRNTEIVRPKTTNKTPALEGKSDNPSKPAPGHSVDIHSFRKHKDLTELCQSEHLKSCKSKFLKINEFKTNYKCIRLCYFKNSIYLPCYDNACIRVYSPEGDLTRTLQLDDVSWPLSLHPISSQHLVLAARSGLYVIEADGRVMEKIREGDYHAVHADDKYIAAIEHAYSDKIHVLHNTPPYNTHSQFSFINSCTSSIHVSNERVYISDYDTHQVTVYSTQGERIGQYGRGGREHTEPGGLYYPVCLRDDSGWVLIADYGNDRVQLLHPATGLWTVVTGLSVDYPWDVIVVGDKLYVLQDDIYDSKIIIFKIWYKSHYLYTMPRNKL